MHAQTAQGEGALRVAREVALVDSAQTVTALVVQCSSLSEVGDAQGLEYDQQNSIEFLPPTPTHAGHGEVYALNRNTHLSLMRALTTTFLFSSEGSSLTCFLNALAAFTVSAFTRFFIWVEYGSG